MLLDIIKNLNLEIEKEWRYVDQVINSGSELINHPFQSNLFDDYAVFSSAPQRNDYESNKVLGKHGIYIFLLSENIEITKKQIDLFNSLKGAKLKKEAIATMVQNNS